MEALKKAIAQLPDYDRHSLAAWLNELDYDDWDKQMAADFSPGGRGIEIVEKVRREIARGDAVPYEEGLAQVKANQTRLRR